MNRTIQQQSRSPQNRDLNDNSYEEQILAMFKRGLTPQDFADSKQEMQESLDALSKAALMELKAISKPHPMIEKAMQIVCALRGYRQLNWNTAKELLSRPSLKIELMQVTPKTLKP